MTSARLALALCAMLHALFTTAGSAQTPEARATHVLNRLTFGPRPGEVERVLTMGIERWIDAQLQPESIEDRSGAKALDGCVAWTEPIDIARMNVSGGSLLLITRDSARKLRSPASFLASGQLLACRLARTEASDQQLLEVMTNFWENHFSIYGRTLNSQSLLVEWDRAVLRPNALGRFRDLLGAVAHSPVMMNYLDNDVNAVPSDQPRLRQRTGRTATAGIITNPPIAFREPTGLNENYARELLELHTLGVDGGYTQADVIQVARAFTGWTHTGAWRKLIVRVPNGSVRIMGAPLSAASAFVFDSTWHDAGEKVVLGQRLQGGRGLEDGEEVLDLLARHPSTARFIARKLAVRLVSDSPPDALIERAALIFLRSDGDIREVVRTIVTSAEFHSPDVYGAKIKSPLELVLSTRRALNAPVDTAAEVVDLLIKLGQMPFGYLTPDGWPETGADWMNAGALMGRMSFATAISRGELPSIPLEAWPAWSTLSNRPHQEQVDGVIRALLNGRESAGLRKALMASKPTAADTPEARQLVLRQLIALVVGSPEFQRR